MSSDPDTDKKPGRLRRLLGQVDRHDLGLALGVGIAFAGLWRLDPSAALIPLGLFLAVAAVRTAR